MSRNGRRRTGSATHASGGPAPGYKPTSFAKGSLYNSPLSAFSAEGELNHNAVRV